MRTGVGEGKREEEGKERAYLRQPLRPRGDANSQLLNPHGEDLRAVYPNHPIPRERERSLSPSQPIPK
jgi:hypothetical protein